MGKPVPPLSFLHQTLFSNLEEIMDIINDNPSFESGLKQLSERFSLSEDDTKELLGILKEVLVTYKDGNDALRSMLN